MMAKSLLLQTLDGALTPISPSARLSIYKSNLNNPNNNVAHRSSISIPPSMGMPRTEPTSSISFFQAPFSLLKDSSMREYLTSTLSSREGASLSPLESIILFVADQSGVIMDGRAQPLSATVVLEILRISKYLKHE